MAFTFSLTFVLPVWRSRFWLAGTSSEYLDQGHQVKVKVTGSRNRVI